MANLGGLRKQNKSFVLRSLYVLIIEGSGSGAPPPEIINLEGIKKYQRIQS
ncbi:hypothetical protein ND861_13395 [Leptospira sp. 2 VSF19]|uniref:Uncharacterized protein n=1 Tax=Leptospira soteropolitanensis TaxID=2950025 RepID=A0ABT3MKD7_9LEPT|nr:hypothetical protein [Leptospira soteropolitanensis]MCW7493639.1 hypothetical protein [Leptospira soteropolitanensis]MCW7527351.1 hypothetical protein [Leptospira soteropolitanensis]